ncbi:hypothetical protein DERF_008981 [Dermatophagoides farinae]|uniref:Uncharacterized protein n=1 Tax=Dermatophagoides farinae TaxID=6954 RepID=A0A922HX04_DERFA|nr:hypothetical protein DERF_008981 [Dermatophagoides farinae]
MFNKIFLLGVSMFSWEGTMGFCVKDCGCGPISVFNSIIGDGDLLKTRNAVIIMLILLINK